MKSFLFALFTVSVLLLLGSGCIFIREPLAAKNEFNDERLPGLWLGKDNKTTQLFYVENCGEKFRLYSFYNIPTTFTVAKVTAPDQKTAMDFISLDITKWIPESQKAGQCYVISGYKISGKKAQLFIMNDENSKLARALEALPREKKAPVILAKPTEIRQILAKNLTDLYPMPITYSPAEFKDQRSREVFMACANFIPCSGKEINTAINAKQPIGQALKKPYDLIREWQQTNKQLLPASFHKVINAHLAAINGIMTGKIAPGAANAELRDFAAKLNAAAVKELLRQ